MQTRAPFFGASDLLAENRNGKERVMLLETLILCRFSSTWKKAPSATHREGQHTHEGGGPRDLGPDTVAARNQPLFELLPGGFPKDTLNHSSRGA